MAFGRVYFALFENTFFSKSCLYMSEVYQEINQQPDYCKFANYIAILQISH